MLTTFPYTENIKPTFRVETAVPLPPASNPVDNGMAQK